MHSEHHSHPSVSRRGLLKAAGWAAPAIVLTTAAPAAVASTSGGTEPVAPEWGIASDSWRGDSTGNRNAISRYQMNFTITVPEGSTMNGATVTLQLGNYVDTLGAAHQIEGTVSGNVVGWTTGREGQSLIEYSRFVFTTTDALPTGTGTNVKTLSFQLDGVGYVSQFEIGTITFSSPGLPDRIFQIMSRNDADWPATGGQVAFLVA